MNLEILKRLAGHTQCKLTNEKELLSKNPTSFTAIFSGVDEVFCLFTGSVEFIGMYNNVGTVTLLVTNHEIIRYGNLVYTCGMKNEVMEPGSLVGRANKRKGLSFEYCTQWRGNSKYPVRVNNRTYYKQNPMDLLNGLYVPPRELVVEGGIIRPDQTVAFDEDQLSEWNPKAIPLNKDFDDGYNEAIERIKAAQRAPGSA